MRAEEISNYLKAVIRYYETGDRRSYADLFIRSYRYTIDNLLNRLPEQLEDIAEDEKRLQEARAKRQKKITFNTQNVHGVIISLISYREGETP